MTRAGRLNRNCCCREFAVLSQIGGNAAPYLAILTNNIELTGQACENTEPITFIIKTLIEKGGICYSRIDNSWYEFYVEGERGRTGLPKKIRLVIDKSPYRTRVVDLTNPLAAEEFIVFAANPYYYPIAAKVCELVAGIETTEENISQNLTNLRQLTLTVTRGNSLAPQLDAIDKIRMAGGVSASIQLPKQKPNEPTRDIAEELQLMPFGAEVESHITEYIELRKTLQEELYKVIGLSSLGDGEQERRIQSEVNLQENGSYAYLDVLIDSINHTAMLKNVDICARRLHSVCNDNLSKDNEEVAQSEDFEPQNEAEDNNE